MLIISRKREELRGKEREVRGVGKTQNKRKNQQHDDGKISWSNPRDSKGQQTRPTPETERKRKRETYTHRYKQLKTIDVVLF